MAKDKANEDTLKRRNADGSIQRVVKKKPVKMNLVKPKRMSTPGDSKANPANLVFPTDRFGLTTDIRKSVIAAIRRVSGDAAKMKLIGKTMEVLAEYAEAAHADTPPRNGLKRRTLGEEFESTVTTTKAADDTQDASTGDTEVVKTVKNKDATKKRTKTTKKAKK